MKITAGEMVKEARADEPGLQNPQTSYKLSPNQQSIPNVDLDIRDSFKEPGKSNLNNIGLLETELEAFAF